MSGDNLKISDQANVEVAKKSPEEIEKIRNGDPIIIELKRRRQQTPQKWHVIAGNSQDVFDGIWPNLKKGVWLRLLYKNGNLLTGRIEKIFGGNEIALQQDTVLLNFGIYNSAILYLNGPDIIQVFVDDPKLAEEIRNKRDQ